MINYFSQPKPIIIGGFYRSGTSLVRRLLDSHSKVYCGPEVKFWRDLHGEYQEDPYAHLRFFATAKQMGIRTEKLREIFGEAYIQLITEAIRSKKKKLWAEKNPENLLHLNEWFELLNGKMRFLFVVRHPLDALASLKEARFDKTMPLEFGGKVNECQRYLESGLAFRNLYPEKTILLRYEDLVSAPENTLKKLLSALNLNYEPNILNEFYKPARGIGIEDPKVSATTRVHTNSLSRWRVDLTPNEIAIAMDKLTPLINTFGYKDNP
jgi:hypothetical protein